VVVSLDHWLAPHLHWSGEARVTHAKLAEVRDTLRCADLLIVGAGFFGLTIAERGAAHGYKVCVIDRRSHIGGNAYSYTDPRTQIEVHKYGPHLFHTNSKDVFDYLSRFTEWVPFELRVWSTANGRAYPMPINLATISHFVGKVMTPGEAREWVKSHAGAFESPRNLEEKAISLIGRPLYDAFIRGYTLKQWQTDPTELPADVITRLPVRFTFDNRYFNDQYQCMPKEGYTAIFEKMISLSGIGIHLEVDWFDIRDSASGIPVVYTGPIDRFFNYSEGTLGWRTLDFQLEYHTSDYQGCPIMNYPDSDVPWTRISEFRHMHPERNYGPETIVAKEYSRFASLDDEPYYPINTASDKQKYDAYRKLECTMPNVIFGGRLGTYRYLDMHQAIGAALKTFESDVLPMLDSRKTGTGRP
jgi:UDP-galactopyranose mutase